MEISDNTILRRLAENNMVYGNYKLKPLLTNKHKYDRLSWAKKNLNTDWSTVIFSDEMSIWKNRDTGKCWYNKGNQKIKGNIRHPIKMHVWACITSVGANSLSETQGITLGGLESFITFNGNLNTSRYVDFLFEHLITIYRHPYIFQQDNSPIHTSKKATDFFNNHNIKTLKWPPNSPDLNPIENLWSLVKRNISKLDDVTDDNFNEKIKECLNKIDYSIIHNLISSMHIRIQKVIENDGDVIDY